MIASLHQLLSAKAPKKTVASVLSSFNETIADLNSVAAESSAEAELQRLMIDDARTAKQAAEIEAASARLVSDRLRALISNAAVPEIMHIQH